ncbi:MAG: DUF4870 domain-containing protein [Vulcanimicrobiaceae bacterium]
MASTSDEDRSWAIYANAAGLLVFTSVPFANVLATLLIWLRVRRAPDMPFARTHAAAAFNFQATYALVVTLGTIALLATLFVERNNPLAPMLDQTWLPRALIIYGILTVANVVLAILGAVAASDLRPYRYLLAIPFVQ